MLSHLPWTITVENDKRDFAEYKIRQQLSGCWSSVMVIFKMVF